MPNKWAVAIAEALRRAGCIEESRAPGLALQRSRTHRAGEPCGRRQGITIGGDTLSIISRGAFRHAPPLLLDTPGPQVLNVVVGIGGNGENRLGLHKISERGNAHED